MGWEVRRFIVGDRVPLSWVSREADVILGHSHVKRIAADIARMSMGAVNAIRAIREVGRVDWVYERFGAFQALGYGFQRRGIPWILETNGILFVEAQRDRSTVALGRVERRLELWAYRRANVLVCVSERMRRVLQDLGIDSKKIVVVPNGVDVEQFRPGSVVARRLFPFPTIGFVGTIYQWQGLDLLVYALDQLRQKGVVYGLVIVGDGPARQEVEGLVRGLGLGDQVRFVGRVPWEEVPSYIAGFDLGYSGQVSLSVGDMYHSPLKIYEYMAMAVPVVAAAWEDAISLVGEDERGYLFLPGSVEDLVRALLKAYHERDSWKDKGVKARAEIVRQHSWEARVREMIRAIENILGECGDDTRYPARC